MRRFCLTSVSCSETVVFDCQGLKNVRQRPLEKKVERAIGFARTIEFHSKANETRSFPERSECETGIITEKKIYKLK